MKFFLPRLRHSSQENPKRKIDSKTSGKKLWMKNYINKLLMSSRAVFSAGFFVLEHNE